MTNYLFRNLELLDVREGKLKSGFQILVKDGKFAAVENGNIGQKGVEDIDLGGRTVMPGLIDSHVHIHPSILPVAPIYLPSMATAWASITLKGMLMRGFTTVRDAGGADLGHKKAVELGLFEGPRIFVSGRAISQLGGHGDARSPADISEPCPCVQAFPGIGRIADGVPEVRRAVRDEIRLGSDQIKLMAGGGVGSIADPVEHDQYSTEELEAVVDEATRAHTYVMAHVYTSSGINRCLAAGVRTIEHGNLMDEAAAKAIAKAGAYLVPNLVAYYMIREIGREVGFPEESQPKNDYVLSFGARSIELAQAAGVKIGYGTDLAKPKAALMQSREFLIRAEVMKPEDIIRSATVIGAEIVRMPGKLGEIVPGAIADMLVVDGDPLKDLKLLTEQGAYLPLIMKDGKIYKNTIQPERGMAGLVR